MATIGITRRAAALVTMPVGVAITSWSYIWRITPLHRREVEGSLAEDCPPPLPPGASTGDVQHPDDGSGPLFHRTYTGLFRDARLRPEELIERLSADPNRVAPLALARFTKTNGAEWRMQVGDEFVARMPGPWDGPIRVVEIAPRSFRFATLKRHLEAGQIEWRAGERDGMLEFQVVSWARSGDRLSALMHDGVRMAKEVQLHMWSSVVERVARESGGRLTGGVEIETRRVDADSFG